MRTLETLTVDGFLVINKAEINLRRINIFIGPQAQGKSVLTKLIYLFRWMPQGVFEAGVEEKGKREFDKDVLDKFESIFPRYAWGNQDFVISYACASYWVIIENERVGQKLKLKIQYCEDLTRSLVNARRMARKNSGFEEDYSYLARSKITSEVRSSVIATLCPDNKLENTIYVPAGRSFFANLQKNVFSFLSTSAPIDYFLKEFGASYEQIKDPNFLSALRERSKNRPVDKIVEELIRGQYVFDKGQDWIINGTSRINVANSSSGQQEALPLAMVLSTWPYFVARQVFRSYIIEEPEAHLFPLAQGQVVSLIAQAYNGPESRSSYVVTTHSPYILSAFNNLIQAGNVRRGLPAEGSSMKELYDVVPRGQVVEFEDVSAYYVDRGVVKSIIDSDLKLIDANAIDDVSNVFAERFEKLVEMEVSE